MTLLSAAAGGILPPEFSKLLLEPIRKNALAFNPFLATVVTTGAHEFHIPLVLEDADAQWVNEGEEIVIDEPTISEAVVTPRKVAGISPVSSEVIKDSSPEAQELVGESLARKIVYRLDAAFVGALATPAPAGLGALTDTAEVTGSLENLDVFAEGVAAAENEGAALTGWLMSPADALAVATLKTGTGSNQALTSDPRLIQGRPVIVSSHVPAGTAWGLDATTVWTVLREDVEIAVSGEVYFTSDRVAIRGTARVGFGFPKPEAVVKVNLTTPAP